MALAFDAYPPPARSSTAVNPAKLQDEIHRLSQRLHRAQESYNQDFLTGNAEVPLDEQLSVIESYRARLEIATEQLRQHTAGELPAAEVPAQPSRVPAPELPSPVPSQEAVQPEVQRAPLPEPIQEQPAPAPAPEPAPAAAAAPLPARHRAAPTGPGIANPDGSPLVGDGATVLRTEDAAVGEYVRHAAEQRWMVATGRSSGDEFDAICNGILAALAHKHGVALEDERQLLARQVDARYRRDYG
jgi:hypothetical protein